jgi:hypothetical protein
MDFKLTGFHYPETFVAIQWCLHLPVFFIVVKLLRLFFKEMNTIPYLCLSIINIKCKPVFARENIKVTFRKHRHFSKKYRNKLFLKKRKEVREVKKKIQCWTGSIQFRLFISWHCDTKSTQCLCYYQAFAWLFFFSSYWRMAVDMNVYPFYCLANVNTVCHFFRINRVIVYFKRKLHFFFL